MNTQRVFWGMVVLLAVVLTLLVLAGRISSLDAVGLFVYFFVCLLLVPGDRQEIVSTETIFKRPVRPCDLQVNESHGVCYSFIDPSSWHDVNVSPQRKYLYAVDEDDSVFVFRLPDGILCFTRPLLSHDQLQFSDDGEFLIVRNEHNGYEDTLLLRNGERAEHCLLRH